LFHLVVRQRRARTINQINKPDHRQNVTEAPFVSTIFRFIDVGIVAWCCLVLLFGIVAWYCCLVLLLGIVAWWFFGGVAWWFCLVVLLGGVAWYCCLILFIGCVAWLCCLVVLLGGADALYCYLVVLLLRAFYLAGARLAG